jgi:hypothetical protein
MIFVQFSGAWRPPAVERFSQAKTWYDTIYFALCMMDCAREPSLYPILLTHKIVTMSITVASSNNRKRKSPKMNVKFKYHKDPSDHGVRSICIAIEL